MLESEASDPRVPETAVAAAERHEVVVIGGGPAGSTAAALLARAGHDVLLLEKERFPREHVGESLLPFCHVLFEKLGVLEAMRARFVRKPGVRFIDRQGVASTIWCFNHVIKDESRLSFQVIRGEFDHLLLRNAARLGAKVREGVRVTDVDIAAASDAATVATTDGDGHPRLYRARFVIDASGRDALIGTKNGWRRPRAELDRTAVWSHWKGVRLQGGLEEGLSIIVYMGEEQKGWIWVFPVGVDRITAGFVAQNSYLRRETRRLQESGSSDWRHDLCVQELNKCEFVRELLHGAERAMPMMVNGDYSYEVTHHFGSNYAMIGDARGFIDPIFSSGVFLSMKTADLVADALHEELSAGHSPDGERLAAAYEQVNGAYDFVHRMIRMFYNPHAITWAEVGVDGQMHKRHESALAAGHFMLAGDFFEHHERYRRFFSLLEDPKGFELYKHLVVDRPEYDQPSCQHSWEEIFGGMVERASDRRSETVT